MKKLFVIFVLIQANSIGQAQEQSPPVESAGWEVLTHFIPVPTDVSSAFSESLTSTERVNVAEANQNYPKTTDEWYDSVAAVDEMIGQLSTALAEAKNVSIEEDEIDGVVVHWVSPRVVSRENENRLFLFTHGGAYTSGRGDASLLEAIEIADGANIKVLSIDYRMPPDYPFPTGLNEVVSVYRAILNEYDSGVIGFGGTSAGGGLALASIHRFKELGLPLPGALFAGTPWADLTKTGDSYFTNEGIDRVLVGYDGRLTAAAAIYAGDEDLHNPLVSPVYGDFANFPPTYLVSGTRDLFLSNTIRVHRKLKRAGIEADLNIYEGMSHGEYFILPDIPESIEIFRDLGIFLNEHLQ